MKAESFAYGFKKTFDEPFGEVVEKVRDALKSEGFGVITEIDLKQKFKEKLDKEFGNYLILGACNPGFAYDALNSEMDIGLLLPCNVAAYSKDGKTIITVLDAAKMLSLTGKDEIRTTAEKVNESLIRALESIQGAGA